MIVPGSNLLAIALSVMGKQKVSYFKRASETETPSGLNLVTYNAPVDNSTGSVQAVDRSKYEELGLSFEKTYITWFVPALPSVVDIARDNSGDVIETGGGRYQLIGGTDWFAIDGWIAVIGARIGPATGALTNA